MLTRHTLEPVWRLRATGGAAPAPIAAGVYEAPVPGDVFMALQAAGAIPDPKDGDNEHRLSWVGSTDWEYATTVRSLAPAAPERIEVVFHGVDTVARAEIDGQVRGSSRNMHRTWRIAAPELAERDVELGVHLAAPVPAAQAELDRLGARPYGFHPLAAFLRKKACDFGWDWGPCLPGSGIWRDVVVESWSTARLAHVRPTVTVDLADGAPSGRVEVDIDIVRTDAGRAAVLEIEVRVGHESVTLIARPGEDHVSGTLHVTEPELWWPASLGYPTLYDLDVTMRTAGEVLDHQLMRIGFRDIVVEQCDDAIGQSFGITVNGVPLFVRGFNWIPEDTSIAAVTDADYRRRIADAQALGANLLRVWGGGVFESDAFYRACDEEGMLVWQDFLFACAAYPEEAPFTDEVEAEARDNVSRLMRHPSLALWNANNENLWFWFVQEWESELDGASWGEGFYFDLLPRIVNELDPSRTILVGSPSSGDRWSDPNDPSRGVVHLWLPDDYREYDRTSPRFVSEFGFQGPPSRVTLRESVHEDAPSPFSPGMVQRQKAAGGTERINTVLAAHFGVPRAFDEWYWLAQLNQARAVRYGVERFRTLEPSCRGTILWQLNDCWPALSWSVIDVDDRWKPAAFAVREAYRDRIVVLRNEEGRPALFICNSTMRPWEARVELQRWNTGERIGAQLFDQTVPANTAVRVPLQATTSTPDGRSWDDVDADDLLVATAEVPGQPRPTRSVLLGTTDRDFPDDAPRFRLEISDHAEGVRMTLRADSLLRDVTVAADEIDPAAQCDINLVTLLPGEEASWTIRTGHAQQFDEPALRGVIRTARAASEHDAGYRSLAMLEAEKAARA